MKKVQIHVYLPEEHMAAIRAAAQAEIRTLQNFVSYLLQTSQNYQRVLREYATPQKEKPHTTTSDSSQLYGEHS